MTYPVQPGPWGDGRGAYGPPPGPAAPAWGPPPPGYGYWQAPQVGTNGFAIASLVLGILWMYWIGSILALVFGYLGKSQMRRTGQQGAGMATAGIVLGWIGVAMLLLFIGVMVLAVTMDPGGSTYDGTTTTDL